MRALLQQALDLLKSAHVSTALIWERHDCVNALEAKLAKPDVTLTNEGDKQEPVAWMYEEFRSAFMGNLQWFDEIQFVQPPNDPEQFKKITPLYTSPPRKEWVGLTDEEIKDILNCGRGGLIDIKKTEAILKDKNNA